MQARLRPQGRSLQGSGRGLPARSRVSAPALQHAGDSADGASCSHRPPSSHRLDTPAHSRRQLFLEAAVLSLATAVPRAAADEEAQDPELDTITHKVYLDIGIAATALKPANERTVGDKTVIPDAPPVGRLVLGLYGRAAPNTVANFLELVSRGALEGTTFSRVLPGEYIMGGQQGSRRMGQVELPSSVRPNPDASNPNSFRLQHFRPGTLSLALSENDDDPRIKTEPDYRTASFLITTGPGPVPRLDDGNIVFGRVLEGMSTIAEITTVPTFKPLGRAEALNMLAGKIGDERAGTVRRKYGRPFKAVVILGAGELPLGGAASPSSQGAALTAAAL